MRIDCRICEDMDSKLLSSKPPPISRMLGVKPRLLACVKTWRACWIALLNAVGDFAPVPGELLMPVHRLKQSNLKR